MCVPDSPAATCTALLPIFLRVSRAVSPQGGLGRVGRGPTIVARFPVSINVVNVVNVVNVGRIPQLGGGCADRTERAG